MYYIILHILLRDLLPNFFPFFNSNLEAVKSNMIEDPYIYRDENNTHLIEIKVKCKP